MNKSIFLFVISLLAAPVQVKADGFSCLEASQKEELRQKIMEAYKDMGKLPSLEEFRKKFLEIQNPDDLVLQVLAVCDGADKSDISQADICAKAQVDLKTQFEAVNNLYTEMGPQIDKMLNQLVNISERVVKLRSQYPTCK